MDLYGTQSKKARQIVWPFLLMLYGVRILGSYTQGLCHLLANVSRRINYFQPTLSHNLLLGLGAFLLSAYDSSSMTHGPPLGSCLSCNETNHWLCSILLYPSSGFDFQIPTDLSYHHNTIGLGILESVVAQLPTEIADPGESTG